MKRFVPLLLVALGLAVPVLAEVRAPYVGRLYSDSPALASIESRFPAMWRKALDDIGRTLGIHEQDRNSIGVEFDDVGMSPGHLGATQVDQDRPKVTLFILPTMAGRAELQEILTHETTHAVMREKMGKPMEDLPLWIAEGLAVWASDGGPARVRLMVMRAPSARLVIGGLENPNHNGFHYAEDYLCLERVAHTYGPTAIPRFTTAIMAGQPWKTAMTTVTGETYETFIERSYQYGISQVDPLTPWDERHQRKAREALEAHRYAEAMGLYDAMLQCGGGTSADAYPRFLKGVCLFGLGRRDEARPLFDTVSQGTLMAPEALLFLGHVEAVQDHTDAALALYSQVGLRFPASYTMAAALYHGSQALKRVGRTAEAQAMHDDLKTRFPQSIYAMHPPAEYDYHAEVNPTTISMPGMDGI